MACDFSVRCTGIAQLHYCADSRTVSIVSKRHIPVAESVPVGKALSRIMDIFTNTTAPNAIKLVCRERVFIGHFADADRLLRLAGAADMTLWQLKEQNFIEYAVSTIKKCVTGNGRASKEEVASALEHFVGTQEYTSDDESDAVAVGLTFFIKEGYIDVPHTIAES